MSRKSSSDEVVRFYFSLEQSTRKKQTGNLEKPRWEPPTTVWTTDSAIFVRVEIAGMRSEKFHIALSENHLIIEGSRPLPASEQTQQSFHRMEIAYGEFRTIIPLPYAVIPENARARYRDGFLDIELRRVDS